MKAITKWKERGSQLGMKNTELYRRYIRDGDTGEWEAVDREDYALNTDDVSTIMRQFFGEDVCAVNEPFLDSVLQVYKELFDDGEYRLKADVKLSLIEYIPSALSIWAKAFVKDFKESIINNKEES